MFLDFALLDDSSMQLLRKVLDDTCDILVVIGHRHKQPRVAEVVLSIDGYVITRDGLIALAAYFEEWEPVQRHTRRTLL